MQTLDGGRIGIAAQSLGIAEGALERGHQATPRSRVQFGKPISKFQNTQFTASLICRLGCEAARLLTYAGRHEEGRR